jgi:hypothetical protein
VPEKLRRAIRGKTPVASPLKASLTKSRKEKRLQGEFKEKCVSKNDRAIAPPNS